MIFTDPKLTETANHINCFIGSLGVSKRKPGAGVVWSNKLGEDDLREGVSACDNDPEPFKGDIERTASDTEVGDGTEKTTGQSWARLGGKDRQCVW